MTREGRGILTREHERDEQIFFGSSLEKNLVHIIRLRHSEIFFSLVYAKDGCLTCIQTESQNLKKNTLVESRIKNDFND